ncbi:hypothetical protein IHE45_02G043400 [Dioscorea alata]|uniref:Uncharacterized protein n=1 Tax=Dioscorea alata TaxID=55571 RepID=A0ACB7WQ76_DIOAL|nr:hypothetical protein IHE45_02G043400 [Dioscorea alata]
MKLFATLVLLVILMSSAIAARNVNKQNIYIEDGSTISGRHLFETSPAEIGIDARINGKQETGTHFYDRMPMPRPKMP